MFIDGDHTVPHCLKFSTKSFLLTTAITVEICFIRSLYFAAIVRYVKIYRRLPILQFIVIMMMTYVDDDIPVLFLE